MLLNLPRKSAVSICISRSFGSGKKRTWRKRDLEKEGLGEKETWRAEIGSFLSFVVCGL